MTATEVPTQPVIAFDDVTIGFDEGDVLRRVRFELASLETKFLLGETGAGKSLILKLAVGLLRPDFGHVRVLGLDLGEMDETQLLGFRRRIGFVFQEGALFDSMTVAGNVAYTLREEEVPEDEIEHRVRETLRFVEMESALDQLPSELSGGMRRRVSIARAVISRPEIVLYDSPTAGLDPVTAQTIITLILRLRDTQGVTSLLATHRVQDVFALANFRFDAASNRVVPLSRNGHGSRERAGSRPLNRVMVLRDGGIYFHGDPDEILRSTDAYLKSFLAIEA